MARYRGPTCKLARREGTDLFLKSGVKPLESKCKLEVPPGGAPQRRPRLSDYGLQLREKQKLRRMYGVLERQFRNYFKKADSRTGITGENLVQFLECRLDNMVYRLGFAPSRKAARQLVRHRHILVGERIVDIPAFIVKPGQVIRVKDKSKNLDLIHSALKMSRGEELAWLRVNKAALEGELLEIPKRADIPLTANEQLIVELYSK